MLKVVSLGVCRDTIALFRFLLRLAITGEIRGAAVCYYRRGIGTEVALTGIYEDEPERALAGADLIKVAAGHQLDLFS
jgi:hypothetical protein